MTMVLHTRSWSERPSALYSGMSAPMRVVALTKNIKNLQNALRKDMFLWLVLSTIAMSYAFLPGVWAFFATKIALMSP